MGYFTHGKSGTSEYRTWSAMISRCKNKNHEQYARYGGRGISVCERWLNGFEAFYADMGPRPAGMTLDRIDNNSGYSPENCRWASPKDQTNNRRTNRRIEIDGKSQTIAQWAEELGIKRNVLRDRIERYGPQGMFVTVKQYNRDGSRSKAARAARAARRALDQA